MSLTRAETTFYRTLERKFQNFAHNAVKDRDWDEVKRLFTWYGDWLELEPKSLQIPISEVPKRPTNADTQSDES